MMDRERSVVLSMRNYSLILASVIVVVVLFVTHSSVCSVLFDLADRLIYYRIYWGMCVLDRS